MRRKDREVTDSAAIVEIISRCHCCKEERDYEIYSG